MAKLRSCPFCGATKAVRIVTAREVDTQTGYERPTTWAEEYAVVCSVLYGGCGAASGWNLKKADSTKQWNARRDAR